jgi:hypothetical protein
MIDQPTTPRDDDVEGHGSRFNGFTGGAEDVGHAARSGHFQSGHASTLGGPRPTHPKTDDDTDVSGHLSGALGSKKKTHDAGGQGIPGGA